MHSRTLLARVERAEQLATTKTKFSSDCICWPENELPFFGFDVEREIAVGVECPVHGKRCFWRLYHLYIPKWFREKGRSGSHAGANSIKKHGTPVFRQSYGQLRKRRLRTEKSSSGYKTELG